MRICFGAQLLLCALLLLSCESTRTDDDTVQAMILPLEQGGDSAHFCLSVITLKSSADPSVVIRPKVEALTQYAWEQALAKFGFSKNGTIIKELHAENISDGENHEPSFMRTLSVADVSGGIGHGGLASLYPGSRNVAIGIEFSTCRFNPRDGEYSIKGQVRSIAGPSEKFMFVSGHYGEIGFWVDEARVRDFEFRFQLDTSKKQFFVASGIPCFSNGIDFYGSPCELRILIRYCPKGW